MLIDKSKLKKMDAFKDINEEVLESDMLAIENAIRDHTHNKFQNRLIRTTGVSKDNKILCYNPYLKVGDTIEISQSVNNGLYVIKSIESDHITVNGDVFDFNYNMITKIEYPASVVKGAIDILEWLHSPEANKSKNGVASESETISRHTTSTTYRTYDANNTINGYPAELFGFCRPYMNARF